MLETKIRAATTRSGVYTEDGWKFPIPNILFPESRRLDAPGYAGGILREDKGTIFLEVKGNKIKLPSYSGVPTGYKSGECEVPDAVIEGRIARIKPEISDEELAGLRDKADIFVLENALELYQNPFRFTEVMVRIREGIGYHGVLYLPGIATPQNIAVLFYMGADLLDATNVIFLSRQKKFLTPDGTMDNEDMEPGSCACRGCDMDASANEKLLAHNLLAMQTELQYVRGRMASRGLRQFVEYRAKTSPELVSMIRLLDSRYSDFQERRFPVTSPGFKATTRLSLDRPDVKRFRERVLTRYWKPLEPDILLILPCSARKPYSKSKSHRMFKEIVDGSQLGARVHELIITSPLGLVPRELELTYPAQHYDIPVTGQWYEDEKLMINTFLKEYLAINHYEHVIVHFGDNEIFEGQDYLEKAIFTSDDRPTSAESLVGLRDALAQFEPKVPTTNWNQISLNNMSNIARFMWGEDATELLEGCNVRSRYPNLKIMKRGRQLAMLSGSSGYLIPTLELGELMAQKELYWVRMHEFDLVGNLFSIGVEDADPRIRVGDEVCIVDKNGLTATGTAKMNAYEMIESEKGEAVRVRHKVKK